MDVNESRQDRLPCSLYGRVWRRFADRTLAVLNDVHNRAVLQIDISAIDHPAVAYKYPNIVNTKTATPRQLTISNRLPHIVGPVVALPGSQHDERRKHGSNPTLRAGTNTVLFTPSKDFEGNDESNSESRKQGRHTAGVSNQRFTILNDALHPGFQISCWHVLGDGLYPFREVHCGKRGAAHEQHPG